ncbi:MAG TPA: glutaminyl-peptide cyclotransferase [Puia sp.]|nr:glutaminyl-peptide cyclotransferase [Puia sp.]
MIQPKHMFRFQLASPLAALLLTTTVLIGIPGCSNTPDTPAAATTTPADSNQVANLSYQVLNVYPHDTTSYTEGLLMADGELYESTGYTEEVPYTRSLFGAVDLTSGRIRVKAELDKNKYFGEGIVFLKGKVYQLTYKTRIGFIYDAKTFKKLGEFSYPSEEGWGMTTDGTYLIMSDSTPDLHYLDPESHKLVRTVRVMENNTPVDQVNELEYIHGYIYANRYTKNYILKIDPASGRVVGRLDLSSLEQQARNKYPGSMEMNGIAYDSVADKVYITGKLWPDIYAIRFPH